MVLCMCHAQWDTPAIEVDHTTIDLQSMRCNAQAAEHDCLLQALRWRVGGTKDLSTSISHASRLGHR